MFPRLGPLIKNVRALLALTEEFTRGLSDLITGLKETLDSQVCRGFVDAFLTKKQKLEVRGYLV